MALDIRGVAHALSVDETKIVTMGATDAQVAGTAGTDFFYVTPGDHIVTGGRGADYYFVGKNAGNDTIVDYGVGESDELVFTDVNAAGIVATRVGQDLLLQVQGHSNVIRVRDQFLGELNDTYSNGKQGTSGVNTIVFADGVIWDRFKMAFMVAHPSRYRRQHYRLGICRRDLGRQGQRLPLGAGPAATSTSTPAATARDVIDDEGSFSFGPVKAGARFPDVQGRHHRRRPEALP